MHGSRQIAIATVLALFLVAFWFRASSLEGIPEGHNGDESFYGILACRILRGESFPVVTTSGNAVDPFYVGLQLPFYAFARPSVWVLRAPSAISGVLAVVLMLVPGARALGRDTALTAAMLLAALPVAINVSRVGCEFSQTPLVGVIAACFAFQGRGVGLFSTIAAGLLVHPTNIILVPILAPVFLVRLAWKEADRAIRRRHLVVASAVCLVAVAAFGTWTLLRPGVRSFVGQRAAQPRDWVEFCNGYVQFLLFLYWPVSKSTVHLHRWAFWGVVGVVSVFGARGLVRNRRWDRVALLGGLVMGVVGLHIMAGSKVFDGTTYRYGAVLIVPTVLAVACLAQGVRAESGDQRRPGASGLRMTAVGVVSWAMLGSVALHWFAWLPRVNGESIWTFRSEAKDPYKQAVKLMLRDSAQANGPGTPPTRLVIAEDHWTRNPLEYLTIGQGRLEVRLLADLCATAPDRAPDRLVEQLADGAYAVGPPGGQIETVIQAAFPEGSVRRWDWNWTNGVRCLSVYRLVNAHADRAGPDRPASPVLANRPEPPGSGEVRR